MNCNNIQNTGNAHISDPLICGRKVMLVALNWTRDKDPRLPLGHACLMAALRKVGRNVTDIIVPVNRKLDVVELANQILNAEAASTSISQEFDLGIGAYVWGEAAIQELLPILRRKGFAGRIILGGPQITFMEEGFQQAYPDADVFIRGNAESALVAVTETADPIEYPGVIYPVSQRPVTIAQANLEQHPSPWLSHDWVAEPLQFVRMETMRGCPYSCSFCQHRAPKRGGRLNHHAPERVFAEIDLFCQNGVQSIAILDPIFNVSPISTAVLERFARKAFKGKISVQCRPELLNEDFLAAASQLNITLEFGLQTIHEAESSAINRRNHMVKVERWLEQVRQLKINHEVSLIFGLPEQTLSSFKESVDWCLRRKVPVIKAFPLMLLRGTELARQAEHWKMKQSDSKIPFVQSSSSFNTQDWGRMNSISRALQLTEGNHPEKIDYLMPHETSTATSRWSPQ
jgi:radical SAM superfamily enzyme YgiQ (UPF0313 family)